MAYPGGTTGVPGTTTATTTNNFRTITSSKNIDYEKRGKI
jgi:hypothetical protein